MSLALPRAPTAVDIVNRIGSATRCTRIASFHRANFVGSTFYAGVANFLVETRFPEPLAPLEPGEAGVVAFIVLRNSVLGRFCRLVYIAIPDARGR